MRTSHHNLWQGTLEYLPLKLQLDVELEGVDTFVTPINSLKYSLRLYGTSADQVLPCESCRSNKITDVISCGDFAVVSRGRRAHVVGTIWVRCDGVLGHNSLPEYTITLAIYQ